MIEEYDQTAPEDLQDDEFPPPARPHQMLQAVLILFITLAFTVPATLIGVIGLSRGLPGRGDLLLYVSAWNAALWCPTLVMLLSWWRHAIRRGHTDKSFLWSLYARYQGILLLISPLILGSISVVFAILDQAFS